MNYVFSFNKYKKIFFFSFLAGGFCPKNLAFARKIKALPKSGGLQQYSPLARTSMLEYKFALCTVHTHLSIICDY